MRSLCGSSEPQTFKMLAANGHHLDMARADVAFDPLKKCSFSMFALGNGDTELNI